jgi:hypothetical protein
MRIVNPYCASIVAGRLWGLLETFEERSLAISSLDEGEGSLDIAFTDA